MRANGISTTTAKDITTWRQWLLEHHENTAAVWLIIYKKASGKASITYKEALQEALCFGWIDSKINKRDAESFFQYFSKRNPNSNWSKVNKELIAKLTAANRMQPKGLEMVALAKERGTWDALNEVEAGIIPDDLEAEFQKYEHAKQYFEAFPRSIKRGILEWIFNAKRAPTRLKRIQETARLANENIRANQYQKKK